MDSYNDLLKKLNYRDFYLDLSSNDAKDNLDTIINEINSKFVKSYVFSISSSQLRNIYHKIINVKNETELKLLRPNLAYIAARQTGNSEKKEYAKLAIQFIDELITKVNENNLADFKKFMEIVVAYHKYHEEQSKN